MLAAGRIAVLVWLTFLFGTAKCYVADLSLLAFTGTPTGKLVPFDGRYVTVAPDLFEGKPRSEDPKSGFNASEFFGSHGPSATDPKIAKTLDYMRNQLGVQKIASTGYCFGGRYAFRLLGLAPEKRVQVAFVAHPTLLGDAEIRGCGDHGHQRPRKPCNRW
ncbi:Carboxymethylenebutenolidase-like protein [Colletotrichum chlorophyti]|uniref:Carboxymethylenebutenolidase-like protein n=1 Tax=Colletotrichum chlorophyti TaxID=708187 RepID=A0A1Q8RM95_9PEZI|nr:Carboxymethylenebutenolidase-like protein [Colletotrichum chlorophyti]